MATLEIQLLGTPTFRVDGVAFTPTTAKGRALLVWLAVEGPQPRDQAATLLWGPGKSRNLRQALYVLRKLPGAEAWLDDGDPLGLVATRDLDRLVEGTDPGEALHGVLARGYEDVAGERFARWLDHARQDVEALQIRCGMDWARRCLEVGDDAGAWSVLEPLVERPPTDGALWRMALGCALKRDRPRGLALWEVARRHFDTEGPTWEGLRRQLGSEAAVAGLSGVARTVARILALEPDPLDVRTLQGATGLGPMRLAEALQELHDAGLAPDGELTAGVRAGILEPLAAPTLATYRGRLGQALAATGAAPERVAPHLEAAGLPSSAAWLEAARRTGRSDAVEAAVRTAESDAERALALLEGVLQARRTGDLAGARRWWAGLDDHALRTQDPVALRTAALQKALIEGLAGDLSAARSAADRAAELAGTDDPQVQAVRGALAFFAGQLDEATALLDAGVDAADPETRLMALNARGALAGLGGEPDRAEVFHLRALAEARSLGRVHVAMRLLNSLGANALARGELGTALDRLDQAVRLAEDLEDLEALPLALYNLAWAWLQEGAAGQARPVIQRIYSVAKAPRAQALAHRARAELERQVGRYAEASAWSGRSVAAFEEAGDQVQATVEAFNRAEADWLGDPTPAALERFRQAGDAVRALGRADLGRASAVEQALVDPDPERVAAWAPSEPATDAEWAAWLRAERLAGRTEALGAPVGRGGSWLGGYLDALALEGLPDHRQQALLADLRKRLDRWCAGLLGGQEAALRARVERWLTDPAAGL